MRGAGVADAPSKVVDEFLFRDAQPSRGSANGAGMHPGDDHAIDLFRRQFRHLQRVVPRLVDERRIHDLAEPLLPLPRASGAGRAPPLEELLGRAGPTEVLGDDRPVGVAADEDRGRAVAALCLVRTRGQARTPIGGDDQHVAAGVERASQRARS